MSARTRSIQRYAGRGAVPASYAQQRFWVLDQLAAESPVFHSPFSLHFRGDLNVEALTRALGSIVDRHEVLRTALVFEEGQLLQNVVEMRPEPLLHLVPMGSAARLPDASFSLRLREDARRKLLPSRGENLRATLYSWGESEHVLLVVLHHVACDGWSKGILLRELSALYNAFSIGAPSPLAELPIQYRDYALWQREQLQGPSFEDKLAYFRRHLMGAESGVVLPTDRPRSSAERYEGAKRWLSLPGSLNRQLGELSRAERVTLFITLMAAFKALLYRYTGQDDIVVGTAVAGRIRPEVEGLMGPLMNTLALRTALSDRPSFRELLARERAVALSAYDRQDVPFEKVLEALPRAHETRRSPFTQVMLQLDPPGRTPQFRGLEVHPIDVDTGVAREELSLSFAERDGELRGKLEYDTNLFEEATMARFLSHYAMTLEQMVADPSRRIHEICLLTSEERHQVLNLWSTTHAAYPADSSLCDLLRDQVVKTPNAIAVIFDDTSIKYKDLDLRSNQLAHWLRRRGVGPGVLVGIAVERSLELVISLLAVLKAGGAYVPLDPAYPSERLAFMIADSGLSLVLTTSDFGARLPTEGVPLWSLDAERSVLAAESAEALGPGPLADDLAYVIYTSGSTGRPKGVEITHRSVVNLLCAMRARPGITERDVLVAVTSISFDIAGLEIFLPLISGARLVVASSEVVRSGARLAALLLHDTHRCTMIQATPSTFRLLIEAGFRGDAALCILCGGEPLPNDLAGALLPHCGALWNMYGPTETTIWSCVALVRSATDPILIGSPIANTEVYVVDERLEPLPIGIPGELLIGGEGVARGYRGRPGETSERFIMHPYKRGGARLYRTGDRARFRPDGQLEFLGRLDQQVKVLGHRIELGEIEAVLLRHPSVAQAAVVARPSVGSSAELVGCLVLAPGESVVSRELRAFLKEHLLSVMVPSRFLRLAAMPLTPNGKLDRRALLAHCKVLPPEEEPDFTQPKGPVETTLASFFEELLQLPRVGAASDFFELGGHSLMAMQLLARVHEQFGVELPLRSFFEAPTVAALAIAVVAAMRSLDDLRMELLAEIEQMTDAGAELLLAEGLA